MRAATASSCVRLRSSKILRYFSQQLARVSAVGDARVSPIPSATQPHARACSRRTRFRRPQRSFSFSLDPTGEDKRTALHLLLVRRLWFTFYVCALSLLGYNLPVTH
eukprot:scaffold79700_cov32-Tisochrysis_lutea.AAC.2